MKTIISHGRKDQIVINVDIDRFSQEFFKYVKLRINKSYIFHYQQENHQFKFKGSIFRFVWNGWDLFNSFTSGEIEFLIEEHNPYIKHKINFTEAFVIALLFTIIPIFTLKFEPGLSLLVFIIIWISYFINYLISIYRFNSYIGDTLIKTNETAGYEFETKEEAIA